MHQVAIDIMDTQTCNIYIHLDVNVSIHLDVNDKTLEHILHCVLLVNVAGIFADLDVSIEQLLSNLLIHLVSQRIVERSDGREPNRR